MELIPVIDLKGGEVVRAERGARHLYAPIKTPLSPTSHPADVVTGFLALHDFRTVYVADIDAIEGAGNHAAVIDALEADGWVTRSPHPDDRRATIISITPTAEAALTTLRSSYEELAHDLVAGIDPADLARCQAVLGTIQDRLPDAVKTRAAATPPPAKPAPPS